MSSPRPTACSPTQVRFGSLHSEIEGDGGRGAEQKDGETHDTIGLLGRVTGCSGMKWLELWSQLEEAVGDVAARQHAGELASLPIDNGRYEGTYIALDPLYPTGTSPTTYPVLSQTRYKHTQILFKTHPNRHLGL